MPDLGVALVWHCWPWPDLLALVRHAEALGYRCAFVDGDVSMLPSRGDGDVLDGWTATAALLAVTERIEIGSIRLVHHWHAAKLAQAVATAERIAPGRLRFQIGIGAQPADAGFGLPFPPAAERVEWLGETLAALRRLWAGETVTATGRHVRLTGARVRPLPRGGRMPIAVAGRGRRVLDLVAAHADRWDVNLPPIAARVDDAARLLAHACRARGRDPGEIARSMWILARPGEEPGGAAVRAAFRRWNPWFSDVPDAELREAVLAGAVGACRERLAWIRERLGIDLPLLDLSGLDRATAERVMSDLAGA